MGATYHGVEVEQRYAEFMCAGPGDLAASQDLVLYQVADEMSAFFEGGLVCRRGIIFAKQAIHDEPACKTAEIDCRIYCGHVLCNSMVTIRFRCDQSPFLPTDKLAFATAYEELPIVPDYR